MSLENNASIAHAVLLAIQSAGDGDKGLGLCVLSHAPGDGAGAIAAATAKAVGMDVVTTRLAGFESHPGAINLLAHDRFAAAVGDGRPVLLVVEAAHEGDGDLLSAITREIAKRVEDQPCAMLAITTTAGESMVARQLARGAGVDDSDVPMSRTASENARLAEAVARASAG